MSKTTVVSGLRMCIESPLAGTVPIDQCAGLFQFPSVGPTYAWSRAAAGVESTTVRIAIDLSRRIILRGLEPSTGWCEIEDMPDAVESLDKGDWPASISCLQVRSRPSRHSKSLPEAPPGQSGELIVEQTALEHRERRSQGRIPGAPPSRRRCTSSGDLDYDP